MSTQWSQTSLPEDHWYTGPAQDHSTYVQTASSDWDSQTLFSSAQDFQPMDAPFAWPQSAQGSVGMGLSPVLSHKSQSSHTLNSFSEPDFAVLPPGMDLSFCSEGQWSTNGASLYAGAQPVPAHVPGHAFVSAPDAATATSRMEVAMPYLPPGHVPQNSSHPAFYVQDGQGAVPMVPYQFIAPRRPLLPRTDGRSASSAIASTHAPSQRPIRPMIQGRDRPRGSSHSVSSPTGQSQGSQRTIVGRPLAPSPVDARRIQTTTAPAADTHHAQPELEDLAGNPSRANYHGVTDPTAEDFNAFIQYDQDDQASVSGVTRSARNADDANRAYTDERISHPVDASSVYLAPAAQETKQEPIPVPTKVEHHVSAGQEIPPIKSAASGDVDEGRHRNHPLYAKGPERDGNYHCPFKVKEGCPHNPTKLKCNYEYDPISRMSSSCDLGADWYVCTASSLTRT